MEAEKNRVFHPDYFRERLRLLEIEAREYIEDMKGTNFWPKWIYHWEAIAQATLAMRHIEDSRMRYGKVIQYLWDWVSNFDR